MKKIGFIGAYDKTDLILNLAKLITAMGKSVLMIDSTFNQKARYVVPAIEPTISYITSFEDIDVAVGFDNAETIQKYLGVSGTLPYDIILVDADTTERIEKFELDKAEINYFVTSFDVYSLKKGLEILSNLKLPLNLTKILFSKNMLKEEDEYLDFLAKDYPIEWAKEKIYFPFDQGDQSVINENQRLARIKFKYLTSQYKDSLAYMAEELLIDDNISSREIKNIVRRIERGA